MARITDEELQAVVQRIRQEVESGDGLQAIELTSLELILTLTHGIPKPDMPAPVGELLRVEMMVRALAKVAATIVCASSTEGTLELDAGTRRAKQQRFVSQLDLECETILARATRGGPPPEVTRH